MVAIASAAYLYSRQARSTEFASCQETVVATEQFNLPVVLEQSSSRAIGRHGRLKTFDDQPRAELCHSVML